MPRQGQNKTVYVGMSGGVDSSVASALLKDQGFNVVGVFMKPWSPPSAAISSSQFSISNDPICLWKQDREDAMRAASTIGIPLLTWDFSKEYKKLVTDYMIREYKAGRTPNPDVMCNKEIKFGLFLKRALKEGADYIATGHYIIKKDKKLFQAKDKNKDQSYFLWTLTPKQIEKCLFPIGDYLKPEVRQLAKKFKLPNAEKKDSQGVCFIGPLDMKEFLLTYIKPKQGKILTMAGQSVGIHDGVYYYTIGQRHGLDIKDGQGPYYVVAKDFKKNIIYVGADAQAVSNETRVIDLNWLNKLRLPAEFDTKVRYRAKSVKTKLQKNGVLVFNKPERAITSGQSAVFYKGQQMLGGGIIY
jgi:tRNA-specific 2-thiouridylase